MFSSNQQERDQAATIRSITNRLLLYWEEMKLFIHSPAINMAEFMHENIEEQERNLQEEELEFALAEEDPRPTFIRTLLEEIAIYADWLSNIVPVLKRKIGAVRICVDYKNLNEASPKDEYPMPMADMLVDGAAYNPMLSFMDGNAGYNQIMVAEDDIHKIAFMCPRPIGAFEYTVMPFGLRNAGAAY
ncbi:unnamed protein product, partial [Prunus brigantina]